eukprot:gene6570-10733_t
MSNFWIDTDIGGDIDDVLSLLLWKVFNNEYKLLGISTCHLDPETKCRIATLIMKELKLSVPIYSGFGCVPLEEKNDFLKQNPFWPLDKFGSPFANKENGKKEMYPFQGVPYKDIYSKDFENIKVSKNTAVDAIIKISNENFEKTKKKLNIICLAPPFNIYEALKLDLNLNKKIHLTMMGGWFEKDLKPIRLGYNFAINPIITDFILNHSHCSIDIISSQFIKDYHFIIKENEFKEIENIKNKSKLCESILRDWKNWENENFFFGEKILADPTTLYFGIKNENVELKVPVKVTFNGIKNGEIIDKFKNMNMLNDNLNEFFSVDYSIENSNVHLITKIKNEENIRKFIVNSIIKELK